MCDHELYNVVEMFSESNLNFLEELLTYCDLHKWIRLLLDFIYSFEINATTGVITTSTQLDRELRPEPFNLMVTATDQDESVVDRNRVSVPLTITGIP